MNVILNMTPTHAAALWIGLIALFMLALKMWVGAQRARHKVAPGDVSNLEFGRAQRVQMNAVEDVPPLMVGLLALAALGVPAAYIHGCGLVLLLARIGHATGLASSGGFSIGRTAGTMGSMLAGLAIIGALIFRAFV